MRLLIETHIDRPWQLVRDGFTRELFLELAPGFIPSRLLRFDGCRVGDEVHIKVGPPPAQLWISAITSEGTHELGWSFVDEGRVLPWPLKSWKHLHRVDKVSASSCKIVDDITFECSPSFLAPFMMPILKLVFGIRPRRYKKFFEGSQ